jgi:hypothetical protein
MFTWICPQCGREVPPSYTECPDCARKAAEPQPDPQAAPPPPPPQYAPPPPPPAAYASTPPAHPQFHQPQYAPQPSQQYPPQYAPAPRGGLPTWAMAILFSFAIFGVVAGVYWLVGSRSGAKPAPTVESPAAKSGGKTHPYQKYIEVSGVRFFDDAKKKTQVRFVLTNHSNADIGGLAGNVTIWGRTRTSEEDAAGTFAFSADLKPYESKELTVPFTTKLKIYELPDAWQNISTDIQITAPQ